MKFEYLDTSIDKVIDSPYITIKTTYKEALDHLFPLIDRLEFQRNTLKKTQYERLRDDIIVGCVMPPITIAFDDISILDNYNDCKDNKEKIVELLSEKIANGFILDGIQRLNTLKDASSDQKFDEEGVLYASIILSDSMNKLLYRMIILNNGQKPMSVRHQIEILLNNTVGKLKLDDDYKDYIFTEKASVRNDGIRKIKQDVLSKALLAYSSSSIEIDNQKIIEDKLNEIISRKVVSSNLKDSNVDFEKLLKWLIGMLEQAPTDVEKEKLVKWFNNENNLIGLFVGVSKNNAIIDMGIEEFLRLRDNIETAISYLNISKIKLGKFRRSIVSDFSKDFEIYSKEAEDQINDYLIEDLKN